MPAGPQRRRASSTSSASLGVSWGGSSGNKEAAADGSLIKRSVSERRPSPRKKARTTRCASEHARTTKAERAAGRIRQRTRGLSRPHRGEPVAGARTRASTDVSPLDRAVRSANPRRQGRKSPGRFPLRCEQPEADRHRPNLDRSRQGETPGRSPLKAEAEGHLPQKQQEDESSQYSFYSLSQEEEEEHKPPPQRSGSNTTPPPPRGRQPPNLKHFTTPKMAAQAAKARLSPARPQPRLQERVRSPALPEPPRPPPPPSIDLWAQWRPSSPNSPPARPAAPAWEEAWQGWTRCHDNGWTGWTQWSQHQWAASDSWNSTDRHTCWQSTGPEKQSTSGTASGKRRQVLAKQAKAGPPSRSQIRRAVEKWLDKQLRVPSRDQARDRCRHPNVERETGKARQQ